MEAVVRGELAVVPAKQSENLAGINFFDAHMGVNDPLGHVVARDGGGSNAEEDVVNEAVRVGGSGVGHRAAVADGLLGAVEDGLGGEIERVDEPGERMSIEYM